jgi:purine-binding chemotaxis protein CheW
MSPGRTRVPAAEVDWDGIKARLRAAEQALAAGLQVSPEKRRAILHRRALVHAALPAPAEAAGARIEVVEFMLGAQRYAALAADVKEVLPLTRLTPLPGVPSFVAGIVHLHGRIVTVIDLKHFFDLPRSDLTDLNRLVVLQHGGVEVALLADRIGGVGSLRLAELQAVPAGSRVTCLRGVAPGPLALIDTQKLMNDPKMVVDDSAGP